MSKQDSSTGNGPVVTAAEIYRLNQPLTEPYHLAFGSFDAFDTFLVRATSAQGRSAWGETTACPGYVPETGDEIWAFLSGHAPKLVGLPVGEGISRLMAFAGREPFAVTPLVTALEGLNAEPESNFSCGPEPRLVPLVGILSGKDEGKLEESFWTQVEKGHSTIKFKVGFDLASDCKRVLFVQQLARKATGVRVRVDANQGYRLEEARGFVKLLDPELVELFEQPFGIGDWESQVALAPHCPVPLMLDESILCTEDIEKTASLGCAGYVKFKLMKAGSQHHLAELISLARSLGLKVVVGNGVAGEIGCYHEAVAALDAAVETAGEMNGFLKVRRSVLPEPLATRNGGVVVAPGFDPEPLQRHIAEMAVNHGSWR